MRLVMEQRIVHWHVKQVMEFQTFLSPKILQDGHDGAVMGSGAWRLVLVEVEKRFDSPPELIEYHLPFKPM